RHLLAPFPRLRPLIPLSVALLRCVSFALASAKNSLRILAHSHLEIVLQLFFRKNRRTAAISSYHGGWMPSSRKKSPRTYHDFVQRGT
ncbi:MAG: hypothetical protein U0I27_00575, partial [Christensenellales bacterium]|nr:hypothetical protein [Christensenellales bacterium]